MSQSPAAIRKQPADRRPDGSAGSPALSGRRNNPWLTMIAVALGIIMVALDGTIVAIANPAIAKDLGASLSDLQWVTNGYLLAIAVTLITAGKVGDRFGHKPVFLIGVVGFALTSGAIGLSQGIGMLIALRVLQGVFGAMLQPTAIGLLRAAFPADRLNMAIGIWGACIAASTAAGPIVGGLLVEHVNWQSVFFINVPVGLVALVLGLLFLLRSRDDTTSSSFDVTGIALLSAMLFTLVWAVVKAPEYGWASGRTLAFFGAAAVLLILFVIREHLAREPLVPLALFRSASLSAGVVLMIMMAFAMFGAMFFLTFYLQGVRGLSPVESGVWMLPMMLTMVVASPIAGALIARFGPRPPLVGGMACAGIAFFGLASLGVDTDFVGLLPWLVLIACGLSPVMVAATDIIVGNAPVRLSGVAGGLQQVAMQVGGALGTSVLGALMSAKVAGVLPGHITDAGLPEPTDVQVEAMRGAISQGFVPVPPGAPPQVAEALTSASHLSFIDGMHFAFLAAAGVAFVAVLVSLIVKKGRAVEGAVTHL
jgi:EmrB/QacA subfamily drug resistance transporter